MDLCASDLRGTVLIRDCLEAEAGFLLVQLIKTALAGADATQHRRVVLLAAAQAASHYAAVLRRAGLQLPALAAAGRLAVVDLLPACSGGALPSLRDVHSMLASAAAAGCGDSAGSGGLCLVVDDLAVSLVPTGACAAPVAAPVIPININSMPLTAHVLLKHVTGAALPGRRPRRLGGLSAIVRGCGAGGARCTAALASAAHPQPCPQLPPRALQC
jgi:hypothetical protein